MEQDGVNNDRRTTNEPDESKPSYLFSNIEYIGIGIVAVWQFLIASGTGGERIGFTAGSILGLVLILAIFKKFYRYVVYNLLKSQPTLLTSRVHHGSVIIAALLSGIAGVTSQSAAGGFLSAYLFVVMIGMILSAIVQVGNIGLAKVTERI